MAINLEIRLRRPNKIYYEGVLGEFFDKFRRSLVKRVTQNFSELLSFAQCLAPRLNLKEMAMVFVIKSGDVNERKDSQSILVLGIEDQPEETISGVVHISSPTEIKHDGITLCMEGQVNLTISNKNVGIFEAMYNSVKPITLLNQFTDLAPSGKLPSGTTEVPFELPLICTKEPKVLYETYHGVFVNVTYLLKAEIKRSFLAKSVAKAQQFIIQYRPSQPPEKKTEVNFSISPETLQKTAKERISIPRFLITGLLDSTETCVTKPFTGSLTIHHTEVPIKSIEIQLVRVETCGCAEGYARDATEIQNIQIADGNVCPKVQIPIYMTFPRLFTCPTLITKNFKIEFEVNLVVVFGDDYLVTENFQIVLNRTA